MGYDQPDDPDVPPDEPSDHPPHRAQPETRSREEYYADLRTAVALEERTEPAPRAEPGVRAENDPQSQPGTTWEETAEQSRWIWSEYKRRWPPEERPPVDRSNDPPGSWRGDVVRFLPSAVNAELDQECDHIANRERETISPDLRELESRDPDRRLIGFDHRIKDRDRIKEKVYDDMDLLGRSPHDAVSLIPDAIRYTFQYDEARYTQSVRADIAYMEERGFKLNRLKNYWSDDQYKGINSQWTEPDSGQRFEVQFHSRISFDAKQITHGAYERLRTHQADALEELVLEAFQRKVSAAVPVPSGATEIPDYREGEQHVR